MFDTGFANLGVEGAIGWVLEAVGTIMQRESALD